MTDLEHWQQIYSERNPKELSWYQTRPERSLALIHEAGLALTDPLIDIGGGASTLVDHLSAGGYSQLHVLDIAQAALEAAQRRLDSTAAVVWHQADVLEWQIPQPFQLWHDRAVFHFLTEDRDRERYRQQVEAALAPQGHLILATFAPDGPERCSGLPVRRHSADELAEFFGSSFTLHSHHLEEHFTPSGAVQAFTFCHFQHRI